MRNPTLGLRRDDLGTTFGAEPRTRRKTFDVLFRIGIGPVFFDPLSEPAGGSFYTLFTRYLIASDFHVATNYR